MKKAERVSLPNKHARIQFIAKTREQNTNKLKVKTTDAPRTTHNVWRNKNIVPWVKSMIVDEAGDAQGIPKLRRLCLLEYFRGGSMGSLPKLKLLSLLDLQSSPCTWILENFLHAKLIATSLEGLVHKNNIFLQFQRTYHELIFLNISYCHKGLSKTLALKRASLCPCNCQKQNKL